ncbi:hypothetical protein ACLKMH_02955 [Psychromonas sp. KJ10-10]|uniref:hypothetical protein n=1 Tax=Psychromonas sp. KJ10-10 TaxID=3391823 RepID=UPI0039B50D0B
MSLQEEQIWLVFLSTHGAGDYPENFKDFVEQLQQVNAPLSGGSLCNSRYWRF